MHKVFELPSSTCRRLITPSLALLILFPSQKHVSSKEKQSQDRHRTSMRLFSRDAVSKSPSRIPFETLYHNARLSHSPCSSTGLTVTSSFGPFTSVNGAPVFESLLVVFHCPSKLLACVPEPAPMGGVSVALNVCDLPEK